MAVRNMTRCGLFAAMLVLCSWLSLPMGTVVISLQSFAVFLTLGTLGGKRGCVAIGVYLALGAVGVPVFSGFRGGLSAFADPTGGYLWGFLAAGLLYWAMEKRLPAWANMGMGVGLCYCCGAAWYLLAYGGGFFPVLLMTVAPYLVPDGIKIGFALLLSRRLKKLA